MSSYHKSQVLRAGAWTVFITVLHFSLNTESHAIHWFHIMLAGLYIIPVLIIAMTFERKGGLIAAGIVSLLYLLHLLWSWRDSPIANYDQFAWFVVYPIAGVMAGQLVFSTNKYKRERDTIIAQSHHAEMINGITGLLTAVGVRDEATVLHSQSVAELASIIGRELAYDEQLLSNLHLAGLVHDIGKAGIPDVILFSHGRLNEEEMAAMREHVELAVSMLREIPGTESIARLVAQHHECPDGSGYPNSLTADQIDPAAAVLRVADIYTALTEDRLYHDAMTPSQALGTMSEIVGPKLDEPAFVALSCIVKRVEEAEVKNDLPRQSNGGST